MSVEVQLNIKARKELQNSMRTEGFALSSEGEFKDSAGETKKQYLENICTKIDTYAENYQTADFFEEG